MGNVTFQIAKCHPGEISEAKLFLVPIALRRDEKKPFCGDLMDSDRSQRKASETFPLWFPNQRMKIRIAGHPFRIFFNS